MSTYRIRRATTDDLQQLLAMWHSLEMPALDLEKSFTDFQIAENEQGQVVAALALQIAGPEGRIHSETIPDFSQADTLRPLFWERFQSVFKNHGLVRVWTNETALYWKKEIGFAEPHPERLHQLPPVFGQPGPGWLLLQLRSEEAMPKALEKHIELLMATQEAEVAATARQAQEWAHKGQVIKGIAIGVSVLVFVGSIVVLLLSLKR